MRIFLSSILLVFLLLSHTAYSTPVINSVDVTDVACNNDGKLVIHATGSNPIYYALVAPSPITRVEQTSNIFENLPPGNYTIAVYDADQPNIPVTLVKTIYGSYTPLNIVGANSSIYIPAGESEYCTYTGRVTVQVNGGKAPYTYELLNSGGSVLQTAGSNLTLFSFDRLSAGNYSIRIKDCGSNVTTGNIAVVSSSAALNNITFTSISATLSTSNDGAARAQCSNLTITLSDVKFNSTSLSSYPGVRYRLVYNNQPSNWQVVSTNSSNPFPALVATNFVYTNAKTIYVEVEHPCTGAITRSSAITFDITKAWQAMLYGDILFNPCTRKADSVRFDIGTITGSVYYCTPYSATITLGGKQYSFTSTSPYFPPNTAFTLNSAQDGVGIDIKADLKTSTATFDYTQPDDRVNQITTSATPFFPSGCDFNGGQIVFKPGFYIPALTSPNVTGVAGWTAEIPSYIQNTKFTITLVAGPTGSDYASKGSKVVSISKTTPIYSTTEYPLWDDLIDGNYTAQIRIEGESSTCTINRSFIMKRDFQGYTLTTPEFAGKCGAYTITGKASYTDGNGTIDTKTTYYLNVYRSDNTLLGSIKGISNSNVVYSNINLVGGTYSVKYKMGNCEIGSYTIIVPEYRPLDVDLQLSGGISCPPSLTADLSVKVVSGSGVGTIQYRIKEQGQADTQYSAWQNSNKFTNKAKGKTYTIEIKDDCGAITRDIPVQDGAQQFLSVIGPVAPGIVCKGLPVTFGAYSIGQITSYQWFKDGVIIPGATSIDYTLPSAEASAVGTYSVKVVTGAGCELTNSYTIDLVSDPTPSPIILGVNRVCTSGNMLTLEASSSIISGTFHWYRNGVLVSSSSSKHYTIPVTGTASYTVLVVPNGGCASELSDPFVVGIGTPDAPVLNGNNKVCAGGSVELSATPNLLNVNYQWFRNGILINVTSYNTINAPASNGDRYTMRISPNAGCLSSESNPIIVSIYDQFTAGTIASDQEICKGSIPQLLTFTSAPSGGSGVYSYQWEKSENGITWSTIVGAESSIYQSGELSATSYFRCKVTDEACGTALSNIVKLTLRTTLNNYPDIRLQLCPHTNLTTFNLSSYLDTSYMQTVSWAVASVGSPIPSDLNKGTVNVEGITNKVHAYTYSVTNFCLPQKITRKLYLKVLDGGYSAKNVDTVVICKDNVGEINLNQILGLSTYNGKWSCDEVSDPVYPHIGLIATPSVYAGARILHGLNAYNDTTLKEAYTNPRTGETDSDAAHLRFTYVSPSAACISSDKKLVIIITSKMF